jgi:hypothetical protein
MKAGLAVGLSFEKGYVARPERVPHGKIARIIFGTFS